MEPNTTTTSVEKKKVAVIIGSGRTHRHGETITNWFVETTKLAELYNVEIIDLVKWNLPFYDEVLAPMALGGNYTTEHGKKWQSTIASMDAVVVVTPEYNHGYTAIFKNAIDYLYREWQGKPLLVVSYGFGGGVSVSQQVVDIMTGTSPIQMRAVPTRPQLCFSRAMFNEQGKIANFDAFEAQRENITKSIQEFTDLINTPFTWQPPKW
ncbi:hypothetical protein SAMD00019534_096410 [Acytostelium subglobosum LB1]|uniref:hypothetical protein n=1 Tax=Acytostelium subglobosum LB1 TaxID=1410327 RepID=UPI0006449BAB|nr:hypothetical protein SAMD00019534_096410 [Acytostelium subglobosum LB1]GAM26466.1 hypothetical protein SAMD00019534_096410 [Acytostelium subglobosum LB1]|eukprot:XP_012750562.1 hypothetical protein SAMD00019534_096410 [Acytostelium subglobosum LB1]